MSDEGVIANLLRRWKAARDSGAPLSAKDICAEHPTCIEEVERGIQNLDEQHQDQETQDITTAATGVTPRSAEPDPHVDEDMLLELRFGRRQFHARGGLGVVFVARDGQLHRDVAVKFIRTEHDQDPETRVQFLREAEITAGLEHPGIVPVYGVGTTRQGAPFYAMRFIQGETLEEAVRQVYHGEKQPRGGIYRSLAFRRLLGEFIAVCQTVAYAHNRGIVHRDIKPENVMLGKYGETLLVDWGLALPVGRDERARASGEITLRPRSGNDSGQSSSGSGGGTPAYMSPEQAEGSLTIGPASDIYSLGASLYKILTGEVPFTSRGVPLREVLDNVKQGKFLRPRQVRAGVPAALEAVCLKAMARDPNQRYHGPLELAKEIEHWLADEPIAAYREGWRDRAARWSRRHRTLVQVVISSLFLVCVLSLVGAVWLGRVAGRERAAREQGLALSAKFAARTVANDLDLRWRILEAEANDPELKEMLARVAGEPDGRVWKDLQAWLDSRYMKYANSPGGSGWLLTDSKGTLVALSVAGDDAEEKRRKYVRSSLAHKDFFNGTGRDLSKEEAKSVEPLGRVHLSTVFLSNTDRKLKVAFSVPVAAADKNTGRPLGVLAMTVDLGQFATLQTELGQNQVAVLCDTRTNHIKNEDYRGLILHHPWLEQGRVAGLQPEELLYREPPERVKQFQELRAHRLRLRSAPPIPSEDSLAPIETFDAHYTDPVGGKYAGEWLAAWEPVLVNGRPDAIKDTGWVVIVQERK